MCQPMRGRHAKKPLCVDFGDLGGGWGLLNFVIVINFRRILDQGTFLNMSFSNTHSFFC